MPERARAFRPPSWRERKPWARPERQPDRRKRGRAGMRDRAEVLADEPLCRRCLEVGRTTASDVVDHILPLAWGGSDERTNKQALCTPCHEAKSKAERAAGRSGRRPGG